MDDQPLIQRVISDFFNYMPKEMDHLRQRVEDGEPLAAGKQAHMIKGASAQLGGMAMSQVAQEMEQLGKQEELEPLTTLLPELEHRYDQLKKAVKRYQAENKT
jgi:HPt (histidine-containing phosphotransfer) domain-containing protein